MTTDQTAIALNACTRTVQAVTALLGALDDLEAIQEQLLGAGINLVDYQAAIEGTPEHPTGGIAHCASTTYKNILSAFVPHIIGNLKEYPDGDPIELGWNSLQKARL